MIGLATVNEGATQDASLAPDAPPHPATDSPSTKHSNAKGPRAGIPMMRPSSRPQALSLRRSPTTRGSFAAARVQLGPGEGIRRECGFRPGKRDGIHTHDDLIGRTLADTPATAVATRVCARPTLRRQRRGTTGAGRAKGPVGCGTEGAQRRRCPWRRSTFASRHLRPRATHSWLGSDNSVTPLVSRTRPRTSRPARPARRGPGTGPVNPPSNGSADGCPGRA
jgi:hypothetical protein